MAVNARSGGQKREIVTLILCIQFPIFVSQISVRFGYNPQDQLDLIYEETVW